MDGKPAVGQGGAGSAAAASANLSRSNRRGVWPLELLKRILTLMGKTEHRDKSARRLRQW